MRRFLVTRIPGPDWQNGVPLQSQRGWQEHVAFMTELSNRDFVLMGGPMEDGDEIVLVADANNESEVLETFADDPWEKSGILSTVEARPWTVMLEPQEVGDKGIDEGRTEGRT